MKKGIIHLFNRTDAEPDEISNALDIMDALKDDELDILLIRSLKETFIDKGDQQIFPRLDDTWRWYGEDILNSEYPLDKLPDHVRDLAKELYY